MLAEHLVAQLAELDQQLRAGARRLGVHLLLLQVARSAIPVRLVDGDGPERRERRQMRRIQIERHLEALLRLHAIAELLLQRLADAVVHLDALGAVRRQIGDAGHRIDGARRIALLFEELAECFQSAGMFASSRSTMFW